MKKHIYNNMLGEMVGQSIPLFNVEMVVIFIRLVYYDISCIRLELEIADAVLLDVSHHIWEHTLDEVSTDTSRIVFLAAQSLGYVPDKVP